MKLHGLGGVGTGKLGNQVFSVRAGQQIVRQYNPVVSNPQTAAQVESRAKLKLASQLAAVVAPVIAIPADGLKTKRNEFISQNYQSISYNDEIAGIVMNKVKLTKGTAYMPAIQASRNSNGRILVSIPDDTGANLDKVIYCVVSRSNGGTMLLLDTDTLDKDESNPTWDATLVGSTQACTVYAYGIRFNNDESKASYSNVGLDTAGLIAQITSNREALQNNVTITATTAATVNASGSNPGGGGGDNPGEGD